MPHQLTIEEEVAETQRFVTAFKNAWVTGNQKPPPFYVGPIDEACCVAWNAPAVKIKMMAIYLHHWTCDNSAEGANHLMMPEVLEVINDYCILWGWDVSRRYGRQIAEEMMKTWFGYSSGAMLQQLEDRHFPCLILISKGKEGVELVQVVLPASRYNTLWTLYNAVNMFEGKIKPDLIRKEKSMKHKSLFSNGSWTKVSEAIFNLAMTSQRLVSEPSNSENPEDKEVEKIKRQSEQLELDLKEIFKDRHANCGESISGASMFEPMKPKYDKMTNLSRLMKQDLDDKKAGR